MKGATCSVCGEAFILEDWQREYHRVLCEKHRGDHVGDPRNTKEARGVRAKVLADDPPCHWCGAPATTIDHYPIPVMQGGTTVESNVVPACERCNKSRGPRPGPPKGVTDAVDSGTTNIGPLTPRLTSKGSKLIRLT